MSAAGTMSEDDKQGRRHDVPSFILLDTGGRSNSTTATSKTSTDLPIQVTFCAVPPPDLSYLFVHCPGLEVADLSLAPRVLSTDGDLVLLRVHRDAMSPMFPSHSDYFVYKMNPHQPTLFLLPNPYPERFNDHELAILSCAGGDDRFVVATLKIRPLCAFSFVLHLYRSGADGWTSQRVSVEDPQRDRVCPIPDDSTQRRLVYHVTTKVITLGGAKGTVCFVDLWRGIILCDLLDDDGPKLRDMPLPLPAKGNWSKFLNGCPYYCRDIAVSQSKDTIKYVEMEITRPTKVTDSTSDDVDSYYEWLRRQERPRSYWVPGSWKMTTWTMPIPATSWDTWHRRCTIRSEDIDLPDHNTRDYELLRKLMMSSGGNEEEEKATLSLGWLRMAHPTLSVADDDVVYLLSKAGTSIRSVEMEVAVDVRAGTLQGVAKLDTNNHVGFLRCCLATGISQHLKPTGTCGNCDLCVDGIIVIGSRS